jgi:hypothetical protein
MITEYLITEVADKRGISKLDSWFFAVAYLLRQSLELMLIGMDAQLLSVTP